MSSRPSTPSSRDSFKNMESLDTAYGFDRATVETLRKVVLRLGAGDADDMIKMSAADRCVVAANAVVGGQDFGLTQDELVHALSTLGDEASRRDGDPTAMPALLVDDRPRLYGRSMEGRHA